jgi:hypothetical protein
VSDVVEVLERERWRPCRAVTASVRAAGQRVVQHVWAAGPDLKVEVRVSWLPIAAEVQMNKISDENQAGIRATGNVVHDH